MGHMGHTVCALNLLALFGLDLVASILLPGSKGIITGVRAGGGSLVHRHRFKISNSGSPMIKIEK
jgi:hypothetical protein